VGVPNSEQEYGFHLSDGGLWVNKHAMLQFSHYVRPLVANAAAHLVVAGEANALRPYVLKACGAQRRPQQLAAELLGLRLARKIGLPAPWADAMAISGEAVQSSAPMRQLDVEGELHLTLEYLGGAGGAVIELPPAWLARRGCDAPLRTLLATFCSWLDVRPAPRPVHFRQSSPVSHSGNGNAGSRYRLAMVGFGGCLGAGSWKLRPLDPEQTPLQMDDAGASAEIMTCFAGLTVEQIARELEALPRQWLMNVAPAARTALPFDLLQRAQRLQLAEPARRRQPRL